MPNHPCRVVKCLKDNAKTKYKIQRQIMYSWCQITLVELGNVSNTKYKIQRQNVWSWYQFTHTLWQSLEILRVSMKKAKTRLKYKIQNTKTDNLELMVIDLIRFGKCQAWVTYSIHPNKIGKKSFEKFPFKRLSESPWKKQLFPRFLHPDAPHPPCFPPPSTSGTITGQLPPFSSSFSSFSSPLLHV